MYNGVPIIERDTDRAYSDNTEKSIIVHKPYNKIIGNIFII